MFYVVVYPIYLSMLGARVILFEISILNMYGALVLNL